MNNTDIKNNYTVLRKIIEQNFPLNELVPEYDGLTQNTANVYCVFHPNHGSPAGKLYWDDEKDILVLHCFAEHKTFTSFDYVVKILCERYGKYSDPLDFLERNMSEQELQEVIKLASMDSDDLEESAFERKIQYISNLYNEYDDVCEFIDKLYTA